MEPLSTTVSRIHVIIQCSLATLTIAKCIKDAKTVDERVKSFNQDVLALQRTCKGLNTSLSMSRMYKAAKNGENQIGGHLWNKINITTNDCKTSLSQINLVLDK